MFERPSTLQGIFRTRHICPHVDFTLTVAAHVQMYHLDKHYFNLFSSFLSTRLDGKCIFKNVENSAIQNQILKLFWKWESVRGYQTIYI